jgi:hypothetical protein
MISTVNDVQQCTATVCCTPLLQRDIDIIIIMFGGELEDQAKQAAVIT